MKNTTIPGNTTAPLFLESPPLTSQTTSVHIKLGNKGVIGKKEEIKQYLQGQSDTCKLITLQLINLRHVMSNYQISSVEPAISSPSPLTEEAFPSEDMEDIIKYFEKLFIAGDKNEASSPIGEAPSSEDDEDFNERFENLYIAGDKKGAMEYFDKIDVNYDDGIFILRAAEEGDDQLVSHLLEKGAKAGIFDAFAQAAHRGKQEATRTLIRHLMAQGEDVDQVKTTTAYDNYGYIKELIDEEISRWYLNEVFKYRCLYVTDNTGEEREDFDNIDIDHQNGIFLLIAAAKNDQQLVSALLEKGAKAGIFDAFALAASMGKQEATRILIRHLMAQGKDVGQIKTTTSYDNYAHIKQLIDEEIDLFGKILVTSNAEKTPSSTDSSASQLSEQAF